MIAYSELVDLCINVRQADTPFTSMQALYALRQYLVNNADDIHVSLELALFEREQVIRDPDQRAVLHRMGYQFQEDLCDWNTEDP